MVKLCKHPEIFSFNANQNNCSCTDSVLDASMIAGTLLTQFFSGGFSSFGGLTQLFGGGDLSASIMDYASAAGSYTAPSYTEPAKKSSTDNDVKALVKSDAGSSAPESDTKTDTEWKQEAIDILREFYGSSEKFDKRMTELGDTLGKQYKLYMTSPLYQNVRNETDGVKDRLKKFYDVTLQHYTQLTYGEKYKEISEKNPGASEEEIEYLVKAELGTGDNRIIDNDRDIELAIQARQERNSDNASFVNYVQSLKDRGQGYIDIYDTIEHDGKISEDEFLAFEKADADRAGVPFDEELTRKLFNIIDRTGNKTIDAKEMTAYMTAVSRIKDYEIKNDGTYKNLGNTANDITYDEWSYMQDIIQEYVNYMDGNGKVEKTKRVEMLETMLNEFYNNENETFNNIFGPIEKKVGEE